MKNSRNNLRPVFGGVPSIAVLKLYSQECLTEATKNTNGGSGSEERNVKSNNGIRILEALSATGLRSIRYAKEIPNVKEIVANDFSAAAVNMIKKNIQHNSVDDVVTASYADATSLMYGSRDLAQRFDVVDLDPYGCPTPFLDGAVQCVKDGGILLITCTDMAVLCGNSPNTCYVKYGAVSLKLKSCHEMALRIVLQCVEAQANKYKRYIVPLLSVSADFYVRIFVKVYSGAIKCKQTTSKLSQVYHCVYCDSFTLQPLGAMKQVNNNTKYFLPHGPPVSSTCNHCSSKLNMGGPIWSAPIHDETFVSKLLQLIEEDVSFGTQKRMMGVLSVIREELSDVPLYYTLDKLCSVVRVSSLSMMALRSAILNGGHKVSYSHANKISVKTNAPQEFVWDVIREWAKENPVKNIPDSPASTILKHEITHKIDFSLRPDANPMSRAKKLVRYQENPTPNWGPGTRNTLNFKESEKRAKNQNRKRKMIIENSNTDEKVKESRSEDTVCDTI